MKPEGLESDMDTQFLSQPEPQSIETLAGQLHFGRNEPI